MGAGGSQQPSSQPLEAWSPGGSLPGDLLAGGPLMATRWCGSWLDFW